MIGDPSRAMRALLDAFCRTRAVQEAPPDPTPPARCGCETSLSIAMWNDGILNHAARAGWRYVDQVGHA